MANQPPAAPRPAKSRPGGRTAYIQADIRDPEAILAAKTIGDAELDRCRDLGAALAAGLAAGIF